MIQLQRSLPLYNGGSGDAPTVGFFSRPDQGFDCTDGLPANAPNPGLVFDKFIDTWNIAPDGTCEIQAPQPDRPEAPATLAAIEGSKHHWLSATADRFDPKLPRHQPLQSSILLGLNRTLARQERLLRQLTGDHRNFSTDWRFVSGLGNGHPLEAGFIWHRTLGVPYLPGSAVKGMLRAWAEHWATDQEKEKINLLFGPRIRPGESQNPAAGTLIVFDALPTRVPKLEVDIMNPHYSPYYQDRTTPPADYHSPVPVFFLTVAPGQSFRFALAPRPGAHLQGQDARSNNAEQAAKDNLKTGLDLLTKALATLGAGGKTAVGYGAMHPDENTQAAIDNAAQAIEIAQPPLADQMKALAKALSPKDIAQQFGRGFNKTQKQKGDNLNAFINAVLAEHGETIRTWSACNQNTQENKAYKKLSPYFSSNPPQMES